jgi:hypothetical protein
MDVTVNKDSVFVAMRADATLHACEGVVDRALRTRVIELLPGRRDEIGEPATLFGAGWQAAARRGSPNARRRGAEDLVPSADRQSKLVERPAETFEQECTARRVLSQQPRTPFAIGEPQDRDLVLCGITVTGDDELQHGRGAVFAGRFSDERLGRVVVGVADCDTPFLLEACEQQREIVEPSAGTDADRLPAHNFGN